MAEKARRLFEQIKGVVTRKGFGDVEINTRAAKDDLSHGVGVAKAAVIPAIPAIIKSGKQIDFQGNWKGRGYDGYIFAAPVVMDGETVYVAAVVKRTSKNRLYLHEVVDSNGNIIKIDNGERATQTSLVVKDDAGTQSLLSNTSIPQDGVGVKGQDMQQGGEYTAMDRAAEILAGLEETNGAVMTETATETDADTAMDLAVEMLAGQGEAAPLEEAAETLARQGETAALERTAPLMEWDAERVADVASRMGKAAKEAFTTMYTQEIPAEQYVQAMTAYYNAGMSESSMAAVYERVGDIVTPQQASAAYMAGQADATTSLAAEKEAAKYAQVAGENAGLVYDDYVKQAVQSGDELTKETYRKLNSVCKALGVRARFVDSVLEGKANANINGTEITIAKDHQHPILFVLGHELTHRMQELAPEQYRAFRNYVGGTATAEAKVAGTMRNYQANGMEITYEQALDEVTADYAGQLFESSEALNDFIEANRTDRTLLEKVRDFIRAIKDKLTGKEKRQATEAEEKLTEALKAATEQAKALENKETAAGQSGEGRFAINEDFRGELDAWNQAGRENGAYFTLGSTGPVLQGLGAIENDIFMEGDKISTILKDHPEMTLREIGHIPEILEDPVLVMKSKGKSSRMVVFGSLKARDGRPIMCVLDLRPTENGFLLNDMQKVNSAYTKDTEPVKFVTTSDILYADKNRTIPLLRTIGMLDPIALQRSGSVGSITYKGPDVNIEGVPFSEIVKVDDGRFALKDKGDAAGTDVDTTMDLAIEALREGKKISPELADRLGLTSETIDALRQAADAEQSGGSDVQESEVGDKVRHIGKSIALAGQVTGFDGLTKGLRQSFQDNLITAAPEAQKLLKDVYGKAQYKLAFDKRSYYRSKSGVITLGRDATDSTMAHELFHWADEGDCISKQLMGALTQDQIVLTMAGGEDIKAYLMHRYPEAFTAHRRNRQYVMRPEYRGIADILNGMSGGEVYYGFGHTRRYWKGTRALESEAWAQFGRHQYENIPEVLKMFQELFPNFYKSAMIALKEMM